MSTPIGPDTVVSLAYELFDESGEVADRATVSDPLEYIVGYAQIVPGLEEALMGVAVGEKRSVKLTAEQGFGPRDEAGLLEVERADFPDHESVVRGDEFMAEAGDGGTIAMRVVDILPEAFIVDTNHPLAGQELRFEVEVLSVREATDDELEEAQAELEAELEEAGGCCDSDDPDHVHDHGEPPLLHLKKKP